MGQEPLVWKGTTLRGTKSINVKSPTPKQILELFGIKWGSQPDSPWGEGTGRKGEG